MHWDLLREVTGIPVGLESSPEEREAAVLAFYEAWDYGLLWCTNIGGEQFGEDRARMGHAEYMAGGEDWDARVQQPFTGPDEVLSLDFEARYPRPTHSDLVKKFERDYAAQKGRTPSVVCMGGVYVTLVSGFIDLFGWDLLLESCGEDPVRFGELANRYADWVQPYFLALAEADIPCAMVHDDFVWSSGAIFDPEWYRRYVFPNYRRLIEPLVASGKRVLFTADGDYTQFLPDLVETGVHALVMEPMTDLALAAERYGRTHALVGNVDTRTLLLGGKDAIEAEVARCFAAAKGCPGFIMAVGNHIPPNTPVDSALAYDSAYRAGRTR